MKWLIMVCLCLASCGVGRYNTQNVVIVEASTGFAIDSFICTALHVVQGKREVVVKYQDGKEECARVVSYDYQNDIALLQVDKPVFTPYSTATPHVRETVTSVANPAMLWFSELEGTIQSVDRVDNGTSLIQVSIDGFFGTSGAPVLNLNGEIVGVISRFIPGTRFTFLIPIEKVVLLIVKTKRR